MIHATPHEKLFGIEEGIEINREALIQKRRRTPILSAEVMKGLQRAPAFLHTHADRGSPVR